MTYSVVVRDPNSWSASTGIHQNFKTAATSIARSQPPKMYQ